MTLALSLDYVVMRSDRGFLYLSETDIGLEIPDYFVAIVGSRIPKGKGMRDALLASKKISAKEGVEMGVVDLAVEGERETVEAAVKLAAELAGFMRGQPDGDVAELQVSTASINLATETTVVWAVPEAEATV
ncbi:uncharacterized protein A4U43_C08F11940 [Asparagus officinalis]|nr:uncharacterized protein A4U43_C08F11940 [Asparagus officinalis]